ncbi:MAG: gliding motility-associated C-terminal domain-containing protein, partial [Saprospiraceae bacterium]
MDSAFVNEVIFYGTNQATAIDVVGLNSYVEMNLLELHRTAFVGFTNNTPSATNLFRIDTVRSLNTFTTGFNLNLNYCDCNDVFVARNGKVSTGRYNTVLVNGESTIQDGEFNIVTLNGDASIITGGGVTNSSVLFPETTFNTLSLNEDALIFGEMAGAKPLLVDTIRLVPGKEYQWKNVMTITANGWLDAIGTGSFPIIMRSTQAGVQGTIKSLTDSICINYIFMSDLDTAGTAVFHAGKISTDIVNNDGWVFEDCCSSFGLSELFPVHDTTICIGDSIDLVVYDTLCTGCTFLWSDGDTNEIRTLSPVVTTTYTVTATRPEGCSSIDTFRINVIPAPIINLQADTTVSDTSQPFLLYHSPTGGTWSGTGVNSSGIFNPMSVGNGVYPLTYTINNGLCDVTDSVILTVTLDGCIFDTLHLTNFNGYDVSCHGGNNGSAQVTTIQGIAPFTYIWSNGNIDSIANNLSAGTYGITVTDSSGCSNILSITITEPPALTASANITNPISFPGLNDGSAMATPSGGTSPYTYLWSNNETTPTINNLFAGTYTVTVTDANGCTTIASVTLSDPTIFLSQIQINSNYNSFNVSCFGANDGSATVTIANGTTPYTFLWNNGETTATATNLPSGWAVVTITDATNQVLIDSVNLTSPPVLVASANIVSPISCFGIMDGSLSANAVGGVPTYSYLWNNNATTLTLNNLGQGTYQVTITDANNCTDSASVILTEPTLLTVSITQDSIYNGFGVRCFNGNDGHITASANGGTPNYAYVWNNTQTTAFANNLSAGMQIVTVTDANNCTASDTIILNQPTEITATTTVTTDYNGFNISCFGENDATANTTVSGGVPTYNYVWNNTQTLTFANNLSGGFAIVTITDLNNCTLIDTTIVTEPTALNIGTLVTSNYNGQDISCFGANDGSVAATLSGGVYGYNFQWNITQTDSSLTNLVAGTYYVTATDANNCTTNDSITLTEPLALANTLTAASTSCDGSQNITANTIGGTGNYAYNWNNSNTNNINPNLFGGTYSVTISDVNNCTLSDSITITTLDTLSVNLGNDTILCLGESLQLNVTQANITNYIWQDNSTNPTFTVTTDGNYFVEITNINGCTASDSILVTYSVIELLQPLPIDTTICESTTFEIDATAVEATQYVWQDGTTTPTYSASSEGIYTVTVTNIYNCSADFSTNISIQLPPKIAAKLPTDTIMCNNNPIILNAQATYATDYFWEGESAYYQQNSYIDSTFLVTYPGIYSVEITNYCGGFMQYVEVTEEDCGCYPYVPNAFTPNNDGNNDEFDVYANCPLDNFQLEIYDRYGGRVFISNDRNNKWDGTIRGQKAMNGVYVWVLRFAAMNEKGEMENRQMSGDVTVVR